MDKTISIRKNAPAVISGIKCGKFNRYKLEYSSSLPLCCYIIYDFGGENVREVFYLESGENISFSSYIDTYLEGGLADEGEVICLFESITQHSGSITVTDISFSVEDVYAKETYYIENERYRLGIELAWGGGLSYLCDKKCEIDGVENILNCHDTGRLVQQSYYGTSSDPFELGEFMNQKWCYNPVQGGDRGRWKSKLIEARVSENEVYIKCRPRDWGQDGGDTYSYMENIYRLEGDYIHVDNRFTDFSGWEHPENGQELPAFYTVSYFDKYYWYDGDKPWTGDTLSHKDDLPFWPTDWAYCTTRFKDDNDERWAAFVDDNMYGIGLFVPNTCSWCAGRYEHDASKNPKASSCNYIAPERTIKLKCFKPLTYSYLMCCGQLDEIRERFRERKDDITNSSLSEY